jgi:quercetin dioxygenase-like cupin family protein
MSTTRKRARRSLCAALLASAVAGQALAQDDSPVIMTGPDKPGPGRAWTEARSIPAGTKMIMVYGSPDQPGPYIFRVQFPAGYRLPAHRHQDQRSVTVLAGSYWTGVGETYQQDKLVKFGPRDYYVTQAGVPHFAWAETDVIIQEAGVGPVGNPIQYVNPRDDPRQ